MRDFGSRFGSGSDAPSNARTPNPNVAFGSGSARTSNLNAAFSSVRFRFEPISEPNLASTTRQLSSIGGFGLISMSSKSTSRRPPRAATGTKKSKALAAIAKAEAKETEEESPPPARKRGRPPKDKAVPEVTGADVKVKDEEGAVEIDWSGDPALTWSLVTAIGDDDDVRRGLFPPPGSGKRNGELPKKHFHAILAKTLFESHPVYKDAFAMAKTPKQQDVWTGKIKNRITNVTSAVKEGMEEMGQTGAGLEAAEDIEPGTALMTKWDVIKQTSPWFWEVRSLIGERPNLRPVGIGNNSDDMDVTLLLPGSDVDVRTSSPDLFPEVLSGVFDESDEEGTTGRDTIEVDDDSDEEPEQAKGKAKKRRAVSEPASPLKPPTKKTKPKPATSLPTTSTQAKLAKPATAKDKFTAAILAEEETTRQQMALVKDKNRARKEIELAKIQTLGKVKVERSKMKTEEMRMKMDLARLKMQQEHELRMAQFGQFSHHGQSSTPRGGSSSLFSHNDDPFQLPMLPPFDSSDVGSSSSSYGFNSEIHRGHE
ncbi:hypothetical protein C8R46DRAFT_1198545 [Mycena filopes]|nr:hypothetical protein C8R46DRAFT_1198545 [Mycena filopes]